MKDISRELGLVNYRHAFILSVMLAVLSLILTVLFYMKTNTAGSVYRYFLQIYILSFILSAVFMLILRFKIKRDFEKGKYGSAEGFIFAACFIMMLWAVLRVCADQLAYGHLMSFVVMSFVIAGSFCFRLVYTVILFTLPATVLLSLLFFLEQNTPALYDNILNLAIASSFSVLVSRFVYSARINEIKNKKKLEEQLSVMQEMAFLGESFAEVVHNMKNPLTISIGYGELIKSELPNSDLPDKLIGSIERINNIVRTILNNSRAATDIKPQDVDINMLLKNELQLLLAAGYDKYHVNIVLDLGGIPPFKCVPSHINQSLGNILKNAYEAMFKTESRILCVKTSVDNNLITISVKDTGPGISKENISKIFDPFFTTKPASSKDGEPIGNGLGLPYSKKIVEQYGGSINVISEPGKGTEVVISLPVSLRKAAP